MITVRTLGARGTRPTGGAVPRARPGRALDVRLGGRRLRRRRRVGPVRARRRRHQRRPRSRGRLRRGRRCPARLLRDDVLRSSAARAAGTGRPGGRTQLAASARGRRRGAASSCWPSPPEDSPCGRPSRCCASATGTASRPTGRRRTGSGRNLAALLLSAGAAPRRRPGSDLGAARRRRTPVLLLVGSRASPRSSSPTLSLDEQGRGRAHLAALRAVAAARDRALPPRWRRAGLALQVAAALVVQHLVYTSW